MGCGGKGSPNDAAFCSGDPGCLFFHGLCAHPIYLRQNRTTGQPGGSGGEGSGGSTLDADLHFSLEPSASGCRLIDATTHGEGETAEDSIWHPGFSETAGICSVCKRSRRHSL